MGTTPGSHTIFVLGHDSLQFYRDSFRENFGTLSFSFLILIVCKYFFLAVQKAFCASVTSSQVPRYVEQSAQTTEATTHYCQMKEMFSFQKVILNLKPRILYDFLWSRF